MSKPTARHSTAGAVSPASWFWVWTIVGAVAYELVMLVIGQRGGALSHIVWWAAGEPYTWRWAGVLAPIVGLLLWCVPHFVFEWGTGWELFVIVVAAFTLLGVAVLLRP